MSLDTSGTVQRLGGALLSASSETDSCDHSKDTASTPGSKDTGVFYYRGFPFVILPSPEGFEAAVLHKGKAMRVEWNGRSLWHSKSRAKAMTKQFIKITLKWKPQE